VDVWQMAMMGVGGVLLLVYLKRRSDRVGGGN
jgi:lipid-A-disaccharide synthase-like uncharacterized protein